MKWTCQFSNGRKREREEEKVFFSFHPALVASVAEVAKEKYFCPLLIWGWLRKRGLREVGGREGRRGGGERQEGEGQGGVEGEREI